MALILGQNVILYQYSGGFWKPVVCARNCSFQTVKETIETSLSGQGFYRTFTAAGSTWSVSFDGLIYLQMTNTIALPDLRVSQEAGFPILIRYQRTDEAGNIYTEEGYCIITTIDDSGDYNNVAPFSMTAIGTGPLTRIFTPTPVNPFGKVKRYDYTGTGGEFSFSTGLLNLIDVIDVVKDAQGRAAIILSGTPVDQEAKYTSAGGNGTILFPQPFSAGEKAYVIYQDL